MFFESRLLYFIEHFGRQIKNCTAKMQKRTFQQWIFNFIQMITHSIPLSLLLSLCLCVCVWKWILAEIIADCIRAFHFIWCYEWLYCEAQAHKRAHTHTHSVFVRRFVTIIKLNRFHFCFTLLSFTIEWLIACFFTIWLMKLCRKTCRNVS